MSKVIRQPCKYCKRITGNRKQICGHCQSVLQHEKTWEEKGKPLLKVQERDFKKNRIMIEGD